MSLYLSSVTLNFSLSIGCKIALLLAGYFSKSRFGLVGRFSSPPPQFGQTLCRIFVTHSKQNVHSKVQIIASSLSLSNDLPQFSQFGLISSILSYTSWIVMNRKVARVCYKTKFVSFFMQFASRFNHCFIAYCSDRA